jgi:hypothetical protein
MDASSSTTRIRATHQSPRDNVYSVFLSKGNEIHHIRIRRLRGLRLIALQPFIAVVGLHYIVSLMLQDFA